MARMSADEMARWEKIRAKGKQNYVAMYGVVGFGLIIATCAILVEIAISLVTGKAQWDFSVLSSADLLSRVLIYGIVFGLAGFLYGRWTWGVMEAKYQASQDLTDGEE